MSKVWSLCKKLMGLSAVVLVAWQLLAGAATSAAGVRQSLAVCGNLLIPSLFPFMVLAALLPSTAAGRLAAAPFGLVARLLYRLPASLAPALLMSWIGGYPAGARAVGELVDRGELSPEDAGEALCVLVNSGPAFMVTVVGAGIFGSPLLGLQLFACQLVAGVITGRLLRLRVTAPRCARVTQDKPFAEALVTAVTSAAGAMVSVCAFVLLMGAAVSLLQAGGTLAALATLAEWLTRGWLDSQAATTLLTGLLEICGGCAGATKLLPIEALRVLPFMLSFGGVSVICQVMATVGGRGVPIGKFLLSRPLHGLVTAAIAYPLLRGECVAVAAGLITSPVLHSDSRTAPGVVLLLGACALLCLTVETGVQEK